ncbi:MAG: MotA/TolQ/ExbB proton channel family protein [Rhodobacteraceae bacterium]|nr:MotA/TolQ/ExbB proton channel family protein [Paracoccaceae bacterium]
MKMTFKTFVAAAALSVGAVAIAPAIAQTSGAATSLQELLERVRQGRVEDQTVNRQREAEFRQAKADQQRLLQQGKAQVAAAEQLSERLESEFQQGELKLAELENQLQERLGAFGELFGVVRSVAGDTRSQLRQSLISSQIPGRDKDIDALAQTEELPQMKELETLWATLMEQAVEQGRIVRYTAPVSTLDGNEVQKEVVRVGPFTAVADGQFLNFLSGTQHLSELGRQPEARFVDTAGDLQNATGGLVEAAIDPSRGALLGLLVQTPSFRERVDQGGTVGYVIICLLVVGVLLALERIFTLSVTASKVSAQVKSKTSNGNNPLGRVMMVAQENRNLNTENLQLKLDDAILKELPSLERGLSTLKVITAVAPMLGLLGTVTGMIQTFQAITLFGTGDPKMMAGGISQALVTTVMGLTTAIPLLLLHSLASGRSKAVVETLEEQAAGIIAASAEKG